MKKVIILVTLTLTLLSCSSSDDSAQNPNLQLNFANLAGKWYHKETIMGNGTVDPYIHYCPTMRDYVEFFNYGEINNREYSEDCNFSGHANSNLQLDTATNRIWTIGGEIPDSKVTKLTNNELHLQFQYALAPGYETRTLILVRN